MSSKTLDLQLLDTSENVYIVDRMVLFAEAGQLPVLNLIVKTQKDTNYEPEFDKAYSLKFDKASSHSSPFGVVSWYVQSIANMTKMVSENLYFLRLGVFPGQHLSMRGYASDDQTVSQVLKQVCDGLLAKRIVEHSFTQAETWAHTKVGTVLSFNETMAQFLSRMAQASDLWLFAKEGKDARLTLHWQNKLNALESPSDFDAMHWADNCVAKEQFTAPVAVRTMWPRANKMKKVTPKSSLEHYTQERLNLLPLAKEPTDETTITTTPWKTSYHLSDSISSAFAWPGVATNATEVIIATVHVYDTNKDSTFRSLLGNLVPGLPSQEVGAGYGVLAISTTTDQSYVSASKALARLGLADSVANLGRILGMPGHPSATPGLPPTPRMVLATVCPWDSQKSTTWAAGSENGSSQYTTDIKVCFDWSVTPVRVPYGYPMSGDNGLMFYPPAEGDRVLVLLEDLWPIMACAAYQASSTSLTTVLGNSSDLNTLSAQRGIVVNGGMIFRTGDNGDLVIHADGNLVLRAEKNIYIDGDNVKERGRAANSKYLAENRKAKNSS
jgi:hypothetical protein